VEPEQAGQRRVTVRHPGPHALVITAWRAPALRDAEFATMVLLDALLAGGKGFYFTREYAPPPRTPLERALVSSGLSTRASSDWQASRYPYVYTLQASVTEAQGPGRRRGRALPPGRGGRGAGLDGRGSAGCAAARSGRAGRRTWTTWRAAPISSRSSRCPAARSCSGRFLTTSSASRATTCGASSGSA
jgi:hypothetical protein